MFLRKTHAFTFAAPAAASIRKSAGPSCAPCATARQSRARSYGVEFKVPVRDAVRSGKSKQPAPPEPLNHGSNALL